MSQCQLGSAPGLCTTDEIWTDIFCEQQAFPREQTSDLDPGGPPKTRMTDFFFVFESSFEINIPSSSTASACSKHPKQKQNKQQR